MSVDIPFIHQVSTVFPDRGISVSPDLTGAEPSTRETTWTSHGEPSKWNKTNKVSVTNIN